MSINGNKSLVISFIFLFCTAIPLKSQSVEGCFDIISDGESVPLYISQHEYPGVQRALSDLQKDLRDVSQHQVDLQSMGFPRKDRMLIVGTIGKSPEIDTLVESGKLNIAEIENEWEAYTIQVINQPFEGIEQALVIAGSDKRGTIFGIYEISKQIGVSPWYWWADVPIPQKTDVSVIPGCQLTDMPKVQYRGIFLNDENPSLYGWVHERYGGFDHNFYSDVFELVLRLKGNYLWTAMWGKAFYDDDPLNAETADRYGIVIGTSHHEPLARAHVEWERYGVGPWDYQTNEKRLKKFWEEGVERIKDYEATLSIGMRGDGDMAMGEEANIDLLQRIVADQREIIDRISPENKDRQIQMWALYKEVQEYYEKGMRVPDDVLLLLADDNWGNVRLLPNPGTADEHAGGWGLYYHFDYVGGPRNYKWINTNQVSRTWEQLHLTWQHGVDRLWLVNVGDLKPMEYPISFFLDYAWNPDKIGVEEAAKYPEDWATAQFGSEYGAEIGNLLTAYSGFNARRKPELLSPDTYSLIHFDEAERIVAEYNALKDRATEIYNQLPEEYKAAFYQLVQYPVEASANLNELYVSAAKNRWYAEQGRAATNLMDAKVKELFQHDADLTDYYNTKLSDGKWNHFMDQTHIGYTYWQEPEQNNIPKTKLIQLPMNPEMGISITGSENWWPNTDKTAKLPEFDNINQQKHYFEIFNRGQQFFNFKITTSENWVTLSQTEGTIDLQERIWADINWNAVPKGSHSATITISTTAGKSVDIELMAHNLDKEKINGFVEANGYISIEAAHYSNKISADSVSWTNIPDLGRTLSGMTLMPVITDARVPGTKNSPLLEYNVHFVTTGEVKVKVYSSPTLDYYMNNDGFKYGVSFDGDAPVTVNIHENMDWDEVVANNINVTESAHTIKNGGNHTLKLWMVDPGVVIQKIVIETKPIGTTYLGPPESKRIE